MVEQREALSLKIECAVEASLTQDMINKRNIGTKKYIPPALERIGR